MEPSAPPDVMRFFHPVMPSARLGHKPLGFSILDVPYVLFRGPRGVPAALLDRCPHRLAPLSKGHVASDGRLQCGYHGWRFDAQGNGASPTQPELTRCDVRALQVVERHGYLWVASPEVPLASFPPLEWDGWEFAGAYSQRFEAPLHVALDNFSEDEHTPFVHTRLGWDHAHVGEVRFEAANHEDHTHVVYRAPQRDSALGRLLLLKRGDVFNNEWQTYFNPVRTIYTISWTEGFDGPPRPAMSRAAIFFVPETPHTTRLHVFNFVKLVDRRFRFLMPILKPAALILGWLEVRDDRLFIPTVARTPADLGGMRLGRYDKPLIHNHKLLQRIYLGEPQRPSPLVVMQPGPKEKM